LSNSKQIDQVKKELLVSLVEQIPFCKTLGIKLDCLGNEITAHLPFKKDFIGNPAIPALHGGIIGSFLEITAIIQLSWAIFSERKDDQINVKKSSLEVQDTILQRIPKTIDITIDYLNSGRPVESFARAKINKIGRRYASVSVKSWQDEPNKPFAMASGHFLVRNFTQRK
tara:strand:+ start:337 stop:846 length:510 start_codon:yes stop_codon:yes gene_type:complete